MKIGLQIIVIVFLAMPAIADSNLSDIEKIRDSYLLALTNAKKVDGSSKPKANSAKTTIVERRSEILESKGTPTKINWQKKPEKLVYLYAPKGLSKSNIKAIIFDTSKKFHTEKNLGLVMPHSDMPVKRKITFNLMWLFDHKFFNHKSSFQDLKKTNKKDLYSKDNFHYYFQKDRLVRVARYLDGTNGNAFIYILKLVGFDYKYENADGFEYHKFNMKIDPNPKLYQRMTFVKVDKRWYVYAEHHPDRNSN